MIVTPPAPDEALLALLKHVLALSADQPFPLSLESGSVSTALSFVSEVGPSAWEFSHCGFRCGCRDKDEHYFWLPPAIHPEVTG